MRGCAGRDEIFSDVGICCHPILMQHHVKKISSRVEAYFRLDFLFLFGQAKRKAREFHGIFTNDFPDHYVGLYVELAILIISDNPGSV